MKKIIVFIVLPCILLSCSIGRTLENEKRTSVDIGKCITVPIFDTVTKVYLEFAINGYYNEEDIQKYASSKSSRLKYYFSISRPLPIVKLNSFSFTNEKGDIIPCILYYRTMGRVVNIIDSLPVIFTDSIIKERKMIGFQIWAECSQSYASIKTVYINYDIEVGSERFIKQCKYEKKWFFEIRGVSW